MQHKVSMLQGVHSVWRSWKMSLFGGWKNWKTISFSPTLAAKAGILVLGLIVISSFIR